MQCLEASELMSMKLDERLTPKEEQALQEHMAGCPECLAHWDMLQHADALLGAQAFALPSPAMSQAVMTTIRRRQARLRLLRGGVTLLLSLIGFVALGCAVMASLSSTLAPLLDSPSSVNAVLEATSHIAATADIVMRALGLFALALLRSASPAVMACYAAVATGLILGWTRLVLLPHRVTA